jgi:hypothetical protein
MKIFLRLFAIFALALNAIDFQHKIYLNGFWKKIKKIMQWHLELKNWYLHHYAFCTFFGKFWMPFLQNGHFSFFKNVQNQKRPTNLETPFFLGSLLNL